MLGTDDIGIYYVKEQQYVFKDRWRKVEFDGSDLDNHASLIDPKKILFITQDRKNIFLEVFGLKDHVNTVFPGEYNLLVVKQPSARNIRI